MDAVIATNVLTAHDGVIALHAGSVCDEKGAAAIVGATTAGKTTTTIACARRGLTMLSDEYCIVTSSGVRAFPRALNVRCGSIHVLRDDVAPPSPVDRWLASHRCWDGKALGFDELCGSLVFPAPKPLRAIFTLAQSAPRASLRRISPTVMLGRLRANVKMKSTGFHAAQKLLGLLQRVSCYEISRGTPDRTAQLIAGALEAA